MATTITVTVKSSGGDYNSFHAALGGEAKDLVAADEILRIDCYPFEDNARVSDSSSAWNTDDTHYIEVRFVDNAGDPAYTSTWSTSHYRLVATTSNGTIFSSSDIGWHHMWLTEGTFQMMALGDSQDNSGIIELHAPGFVRFDGGGILISGLVDSVEAWRGIKLDDNAQVRFRNWMIYGGGSNPDDMGQAALNIPSNVGKITCENCTFDDWEWGILNQSPGNPNGFLLINCRFTNLAGSLMPPWADEGIDSNSNYNLTDNSTHIPANWGANSLDGTDTPTISYVDATNATLENRDYTLNSNSDSGYQAATDLSGSFTVDIANTTRTVPWDIGAHERSSSVPATLVLNHWRLRNDDGNEATGGATFIKPEDTGMTIGTGGDVALDTNFRIRIGLDESNVGDPVASVIQLRAKKNGGAAFDVTGASTDVRMSASANFADGAATTDHGFTVPGGSFFAGEILETDGSTSSLDLGQNDYTVIEACMQARAADLVDTDTLEFGIRHNSIDYFPGVTAITIVLGSGPAIATSFVAANVTGTTIPVNWTDTNSETATPILWISTDSQATWVLVAELSDSDVSYVFDNLSVGTTYDVGITYWISPNQSTMATVTQLTLGSEQSLSPTAPSLTMSALDITLSSGSAPTRDPPTGGGGSIRVIIRCG